MQKKFYTVSTRIIPVEKGKRNEQHAYMADVTPKQELDSDSVKQIFKQFQKELGRFVSKVFIDATPNAQEVGWVFERKRRYEDDPKNYYIQESWVTLYHKCEHCSGGFNYAGIQD